MCRSIQKAALFEFNGIIQRRRLTARDLLCAGRQIPYTELLQVISRPANALKLLIKSYIV
jgi:hypothetical protein